MRDSFRMRSQRSAQSHQKVFRLILRRIQSRHNHSQKLPAAWPYLHGSFCHRPCEGRLLFQGYIQQTSGLRASCSLDKSSSHRYLQAVQPRLGERVLVVCAHFYSRRNHCAYSQPLVQVGTTQQLLQDHLACSAQDFEPTLEYSLTQVGKHRWCRHVAINQKSFHLQTKHCQYQNQDHEVPESFCSHR